MDSACENAQDNHYDCIIVGGGLAGLSLSILLAKDERKVLLLEKNTYPYQKVCGEYVSMECWDFLIRLGIPIHTWELPLIRQLKMSTVDGKEVNENLDLGGFGVSRYRLDSELAALARSLGVELMENSKVTQYHRREHEFEVQTNAGRFSSRVLCASFGKHAGGNFYKPERSGENWVGVKYHIQFTHPYSQIALHNFDGGYCGMSRIEDGKSCLCYLVKASKLLAHGGDIHRLENEVLSENPNLRKIFRQAKFLSEEPSVISNISFKVRKPVHDLVFYLGDAAGTIAPLSGNGMSMAFRAAFLLAQELKPVWDGQISLSKAAANYEEIWKRHFKQRISTGRWIQYFFCKNILTGFFIRLMANFSHLRRAIIRNTHGSPF